MMSCAWSSSTPARKPVSRKCQRSRSRRTQDAAAWGRPSKIDYHSVRREVDLFTWASFATSSGYPFLALNAQPAIINHAGNCRSESVSSLIHAPSIVKLMLKPSCTHVHGQQAWLTGRGPFRRSASCPSLSSLTSYQAGCDIRRTAIMEQQLEHSGTC